MKGVVILCMLVAMATVQAGPVRKRFFVSNIKDAFNKVGDFFKNTYNKAKDAFNKVVKGIDFDRAVDVLSPMIHSGMTVTACTTTCVGASATILGPAAPLARTACKPLCDASLAKLEDIAG